MRTIGSFAHAVLALTGLLASTLPATAEDWTVHTSPTAVDLTGATASPTQTAVVGRAGTMLTSPDGVTWNPFASGTSADLFDIAYNASGYAISGREVVLEWDGVGTPVPLVATSDDETFTPVMPTVTSIWYGNPSFSGFGFSSIVRYDRTTGPAGGFVTQGPVLAMCPATSGGVVYVTKRGDFA